MKNLPTSNAIFLCAAYYAQVIQNPCHEANPFLVTGFRPVGDEPVEILLIQPES
jgi:hypothetical protein